MTTKELINQYVTAHADNRWMDASELEALLTEFAEKLKEPASEEQIEYLAKAMDEADKRKEALQNERELNPDAFTKEVSADNLEKISQRAEYNANDYIGHPFDEGENESITYARESYEAGFKQGWQEGETYGFGKGFDFCEQTKQVKRHE